MGRLYISFIVIIAFVLINCKKSNLKEEIGIKFETSNKKYNFGDIRVNDTITHSFYVKNLSKQNLIISKVATSCGCTSVGNIDSLIMPNKKTEIKIQFIAKKEQVGSITNSIVVEMNTKPPFTVFRLEGNVKH